MDAAEIRAHKGQSGSEVREIYRVKGVIRTVVLVIDVPWTPSAGQYKWMIPLSPFNGWAGTSGAHICVDLVDRRLGYRHSRSAVNLI